MKSMLAFVVAAALTVALAATQAVSAIDLYQEALYTQEVKGDLPKAIELYQSIVSRFAGDRAVAPKALYQLALCYEAQGSREAGAFLQRIVRDYPEARDVAAAARRKLSATAPGAARVAAVQSAPRRLTPSDVAFQVADVSASGQRILGREGRDLVLRDVSTGERSVLVAATGLGQVGPAVISSDGRQVAYSWIETGPNANWLVAVIGTEPNARPRRLLGAAGPSGRASHPVAWSPDGKAVLVRVNDGEGDVTSLRSALAWVSVASLETRVIRSLGPGRPVSGIELSPDGRFVAYSSPSGSTEAVNREANAPRRIFVASLEGPAESEVVKMVGSHENPVWTPDGTRLLFESDRLGAQGLWSVQIQAGEGVGAPSRVLAGFTGTPVRVSDSGALVYFEFKGSGGSVTYIAERGPGGRIITSFEGGGGDWSPDGRSLAFKPMNGLGSEVIVRSIDTGAERSYRHEGIQDPSPHWLGSKGFVVFIRDPSTGGAPHFVDVATGEFRRLYGNRLDGFARASMTMPDDGVWIYQLLRKLEKPEIIGVAGVNPTTGTSDVVVMFPEPLNPQPFPALDVSPDGSTVAIAWKPAGNNIARLFTIRTDGTGYRLIGEPFQAGNLPDTLRWTPDGAAILFVTTDGSRSRVMKIPASGGAATFEGVEVAGPIWNIDPSPDGTRLAYSTNQPVSAEVWAIDNVLSALESR